MEVGYVRLSRDDNKKNYVSIENQKLIIKKYAEKQGYKISRWYEDDGVSGYIFTRPGFSQMLNDLDEIDTIIAKDLSRIGRHNAKILLFLEEIKEAGKRIILIDDDYDSHGNEDDVLGIKTWYNERYVKDASKKIKRVISERQKEGTLIIGVPFGYYIDSDKQVKIDEAARKTVELIYELYSGGYGFRKLADKLNEMGIKTPSMHLQEKAIENHKAYNRTIAPRWNESMVSDIIKNDYYTGTLRTHKIERQLVHGRDQKIKREDQNIFENHHEAIITKERYYQIQELTQNRYRTNYRGNKKYNNLFTSFLICSDCNCRMTVINKPNKKYYVCATYNKKGKSFCPYAHTVYEDTIIDAIITYVKMCRDNLSDTIKNFDINKINTGRSSRETYRSLYLKEMEKTKNELKVVINQKVKEIVVHPNMKDILGETYDSLITEKTMRIKQLEEKLSIIQKDLIPKDKIESNLKNALEIIDDVIEKQSLNRKDIELLINKIIVDKDGCLEIYFKYGIGKLANFDLQHSQKSKKLQIMITITSLLKTKEYTSAKNLSNEMKAKGFHVNNKSILPYLEKLMEMNILEKTDLFHKPYKVITDKQTLEKIETELSKDIEL